MGLSPKGPAKTLPRTVNPMHVNQVMELMRILNWAQINGATATADAARTALVKLMAPVVTAYPFALAS